jgi:hypothetical protein
LASGGGKDLIGVMIRLGHFATFTGSSHSFKRRTSNSYPCSASHGREGN